MDDVHGAKARCIYWRPPSATDQRLMTALAYTLLDAPLWPLMNKFYRSHQSSMKAVKDAQLWVARHEEIIAGLCLRPVADGFWLTGLFVAPESRRQGVAAALIDRAVTACGGPVRLFCEPGLQGFYEGVGFSLETRLPAALHERLVRYQRSKAMIAMGIGS